MPKGSRSALRAGTRPPFLLSGEAASIPGFATGTLSTLDHSPAASISFRGLLRGAGGCLPTRAGGGLPRAPPRTLGPRPESLQGMRQCDSPYSLKGLYAVSPVEPVRLLRSAGLSARASPVLVAPPGDLALEQDRNSTMERAYPVTASSFISSTRAKPSDQRTQTLRPS